MEELVTESTSINEPAAQLMKFHGSYMQDHREKRSFGQGKFYQFMMRTRQPGGAVTNQLYKTMDDLADQYGNGTLRLTTRQTYQLHGVLKGDLKTVFSSVIKNMGSTLGACGDVNRNIMAPPNLYRNDKRYQICLDYANDIADLLAPQAGAYYDVWLDGEKFMSATKENPEVTRVRNDNSNGTNFEGSPEPIYGTQFLPRKFKVGITVPGDNHIDMFTNDLGLVCITDDNQELLGFNLYAGGGMGRSHRNNSTFPRLASPIGYVPKEHVFQAVKAVVCVQRDYGRRDDRKQARLKYLINDWGVPKFTSVTEQYMGAKFEPVKALPEWTLPTYLGWGDHGDGKLFYGVHCVNGRLRGEMKKALRTVIERYELPVMLTAQQDLVLTDIEPGWKADIISTLSAAGVRDEVELEGLESLSIACPAMPLCGLAIGEAERGLPNMQLRMRAVLKQVGLPDEKFVTRMTGCPNGCARPYMAECGFVGDGPNSYQVWLGGSPALDRLAEPYAEKVKVADLETFFEPLFYFFKSRRNNEESFGDFCARVGFETLRAYQDSYVAPPTVARMPRVMVERETFDALKAAAEARGATLSEVATDAIKAYLDK